MRTVVTGGAGFIGSALVELLLRSGHEVVVIDDLSGARAENIPAEVPVAVVDIRSDELHPAVAAARPEIVFHLAAQIDVNRSLEKPATDASVNVLGTINVADAAVSAGCRRLIFASSGGAIYGDAARLPTDEQTVVAPLSPYGVSKRAAEMYLDLFSRLRGLSCCHVALANVYGPRQGAGGEGGVVAIFIDAMLSGRPTRIFGDGGNTRDYVFVEDVAAAFLAAAERGNDRARYNIGTGVQTTDRNLHRAIAAALDVPDAPEFVPAIPGAVRRSALDSSRARAELGWEPQWTVDRGIDATIAYHREQLQRSGS